MLVRKRQANALSNDLDGTLKNQSLAYKYKEKMLPGEKFPNPKTVLSYKGFIDDKRFIEDPNKMK